jgi:hypothetical protein
MYEGVPAYFGPRPTSCSRRASPKPAAQAGPAPARDDKRESIPLDDILYVKALVGRHGPGPLHTLIDAFAK